MKPFTANAHQAAAFAKLPMGGEMLFIVPMKVQPGHGMVEFGIQTHVVTSIAAQNRYRWKNPETGEHTKRFLAPVIDSEYKIVALNIGQISTITTAQALFAGFTTNGGFTAYGNLVEHWHKNHNRRYPWESNPWAWLITVKKVER